MSVEENKAVVRRFFEMLNAGNLSALDDILAPSYAGHFGGAPQMDRTAFKQFVGAFFTALPDLHHAVEDLFGEGDKIALRLTLSGTHRGPFQGLAPTGKHVSFSAINTMQLRDGKIVEHWSEFDGIGMMQQLGAMPAPA
ncbi:MAG TPA: ester cyclase [Herpetosiphonaceae bacterium]|nr:ester cyclase [Herpetosiphonaceae bacterium]